jgi:hypothetical protein
VADVKEMLKDFRIKAYSMSPEFGRKVDMLILDGVGMGASISVSDALSKLVNGLADAAASTQIGVKNYYDAMTAVQQMQAANRAGVSVDTYRDLTNVKNMGTSLISDPNAPTANVFGIPVWVILGGVALILLTRR